MLLQLTQKNEHPKYIHIKEVNYNIETITMESASNLDVMFSVIKLIIYVYIYSIQRDNRIRNSKNYLSFDNDHFIIVNNNKILKKNYTKTIFDEMWYNFEYLIVNIFSFIIVCSLRKIKMRIIFINHD